MIFLNLAAKVYFFLINIYFFLIKSLSLQSEFWKRSFMDPFRIYSIPIRGLYDGLHRYEFEIGEDFFRLFEASPIGEGSFHVAMDIDKNKDLSTVSFSINGWMREVCDRCLVDIRLPVVSSCSAILKKGEGDDIDPDLIYIPEEAHEWNIAHLIYDYICLSIPFRKTIDCKKLSPSPCDQEILKKIQNYGPSEDNSVWDVLKDF